MNQNTSDMQVITIKVPASDHKALVALAARQERSMAAQVRFAIKTMLYASEPQAQEPPADDPDDEHPF